jgi:hypothetical protein
MIFLLHPISWQNSALQLCVAKTATTQSGPSHATGLNITPAAVRQVHWNGG